MVCLSKTRIGKSINAKIANIEINHGLEIWATIIVYVKYETQDKKVYTFIPIVLSLKIPTLENRI